jgi:hypothetical protein
MKLTKLLLLSFICLLMSVAGNAQERAKNRAENKANQRVDQKVDQAVDKAADAIEGLFRRKKQDQPEGETPTEEGEVLEDGTPAPKNGGGGFSGINFGGEFEPYQNPVKMNLSMDMVSTDKRGKVQNLTMHYTFDTWATGMEMISDDGTTRILMDNQEGKMTMITEDGDKTQGVRMRQPKIEYGDFVPEESEFTITDLGNTKVINGYNCREYLIEHEDGTTNAWLTNDLEVDREANIRAMSAQMRQKKGNNFSANAFAVEGFPIESTSVSKDGKETTKMTYYNLNFGDDINMDVFDIRGIEIMSIGF